MTQIADTRTQPAALTKQDTAGSRAQPAGHAAKGKVLETRDGRVVFQPRGTNYELHLAAEDYRGPVGKPTLGVIRVKARKLYTVPSGGLFIAPILGQPRTIQGRVLAVSGEQVVIHAGGPVLVDLPADAHAVDLASGPVREGAMVNVVAQPGARFEAAE